MSAYFTFLFFTFLLFCPFVHALGRYSVARLIKVKVREYSLFSDRECFRFPLFGKQIVIRLIPFPLTSINDSDNEFDFESLESRWNWKRVLISISGIAAISLFGVVVIIFCNLHDGTFFKKCVVESVDLNKSVFGIELQAGDEFRIINDAATKDYLGFVRALYSEDYLGAVQIKRNEELIELYPKHNVKIYTKKGKFPENELFGAVFEENFNSEAILKTLVYSIDKFALYFKVSFPFSGTEMRYINRTDLSFSLTSFWGLILGFLCALSAAWASIVLVFLCSLKLIKNILIWIFS